MPVVTQTGVGSRFITIGVELPYFTRSFEIYTDLLLPSDYNGDVFLGAINRYHKAGQIFGLYNGAVVWQSFLEYPYQFHGVYVRNHDTDFPLFTVLDGVTWDYQPPETKNIDPGTISAESFFWGRFNWVRAIADIVSGITSTTEAYLEINPLKLFTKFKPGLYGLTRPIDAVVIEVFRDDVSVDVQLLPIR